MKCGYRRPGYKHRTPEQRAADLERSIQKSIDSDAKERDEELAWLVPAIFSLVLLVIAMISRHS